MDLIIELLFRPVESAICFLFNIGCSISIWLGETLARLVKKIFRIKEGSEE